MSVSDMGPIDLIRISVIMTRGGPTTINQSNI